MAKQDRSKASGGRTEGKPKSGKFSKASKEGQRRTSGRFGNQGKFTGLKAGTFAQMREAQDLVAFASPGNKVAVRIYVEGLESFQSQKRQPRNLVLILTEGHDQEFEAYQVDFEEVAPLIPKANLVDSERPYYSFQFKRRWLSVADGTQVAMKKLEKRV